MQCGRHLCYDHFNGLKLAILHLSVHFWHPLCSTTILCDCQGHLDWTYLLLNIHASVSHVTKLGRVNRGEAGLPVPLQDTSQSFITMFYSQRLHQISNKSGIEIVTQQWILNHLMKVKKSEVGLFHWLIDSARKKSDIFLKGLSV